MNRNTVITHTRYFYLSYWYDYLYANNKNYYYINYSISNDTSPSLVVIEVVRDLLYL